MVGALVGYVEKRYALPYRRFATSWACAMDADSYRLLDQDNRQLLQPVRANRPPGRRCLVAQVDKEVPDEVYHLRARGNPLLRYLLGTLSRGFSLLGPGAAVGLA